MKNYYKLFEEFPEVSTKEWKKKITEDLKNKSAYDKLVWQTYEGFCIEPFYRYEDINNNKQIIQKEFSFIRGNNVEKKKWRINQDCLLTDIDIPYNLIANGVDSLGLYINNDKELSKFKNLIKNIDIEKISVNKLNNHYNIEFVNVFADKCKEQKIDANKINGSLGFDILKYFTYINDSEIYDTDAIFKELPDVLDLVSRHLPLFKLVDVNGIYFNNAGSSIVQELAFCLSAAVEYLSFMTDKGFSVDRIAKSIQFKFAVGSDYFLEIAKLRAARHLWAKIVESYECQDSDSKIMFVHAVTSGWNKTIYDPYVNMIRTTTEAMSAIIGGIDVLTIVPFDSTYKSGDEFSYRIAKNQQLILKEEAYLDKVIDPAGGSYYIEKITENIIEKTWETFLLIEKSGGFVQSFKKNIIQTEIVNTAKKRNTDIASGRKVFVGINKYPDKTKTAEINTGIIEQEKPCFNELEKNLLWNYRGVSEFEHLRFSVETRSKQPVVFLLKYGDFAMQKARAEFAANFFACGGFDIVQSKHAESIESEIQSAIKNKADITVICSSDEEYPLIVPDIVGQLKNQTILIIAGNPVNHIKKLKEAGVYDFIHTKTNIIKTLTDILKQIENK